MSHLKELILLFLINIIIIACSKDLEIDTTTKANASPFSTYYFVIKSKILNISLTASLKFFEEGKFLV